MSMNIEKKIDNKKLGKNALTFNSYLDDYFGLIILVFILLVFMGSFFFLWSPRFSDAIDTVNSVKLQLSEEKTQLFKYKNSIIEYKEAYATVSINDKNKIANMIGPRHEYSSIYHVDLLMTLQDLVSETDYVMTNIAISDVDVLGIPKRKTVKTVEVEDDSLPQGIVGVNVEFDLENINYEGLKEVLSLLETKLRLVDIQDVVFTPKSESCSIELITYLFDSEE